MLLHHMTMDWFISQAPEWYPDIIFPKGKWDDFETQIEEKGINGEEGEEEDDDAEDIFPVRNSEETFSLLEFLDMNMGKKAIYTTHHPLMIITGFFVGAEEGDEQYKLAQKKEAALQTLLDKYDFIPEGLVFRVSERWMPIEEEGEHMDEYLSQADKVVHLHLENLKKFKIPKRIRNDGSRMVALKDRLVELQEEGGKEKEIEELELDIRDQAIMTHYWNTIRSMHQYISAIGKRAEMEKGLISYLLIQMLDEVNERFKGDTPADFYFLQVSTYVHMMFPVLGGAHLPDRVLYQKYIDSAKLVLELYLRHPHLLLEPEESQEMAKNYKKYFEVDTCPALHIMHLLQMRFWLYVRTFFCVIIFLKLR